MKDNDLVGIAFIDTQVYIHQMFCLNSMILVADVYKSISLLRFQEEYRTLSLVSKVRGKDSKDSTKFYLFLNYRTSERLRFSQQSSSSTTLKWDS